MSFKIGDRVSVDPRAGDEEEIDYEEVWKGRVGTVTQIFGTGIGVKFDHLNHLVTARTSQLLLAKDGLDLILEKI